MNYNINSDINAINISINSIQIIDQTKLPLEEIYIKIKDYKTMIDAIKKLKIRGAPAIGVAASAACYLAACEIKNSNNYKEELLTAIKEIEESRPTAVNLFLATRALKEKLKSLNSKDEIKAIFFQKTQELYSYEEASSYKMGENGLNIFGKHKKINILTHCNTGSLATIGIGTALGVIRALSKFNEVHVFVDETRPLLQGASLKTWELKKSQISYTLITDNAAATLMNSQKIDFVITGADRIARNGDSANKIGTLNLAVLCNYFKIPFYIVAPESTIDRQTETGKEIKIEQRDGKEVKKIMNSLIIAPQDSKVFNPAFDVTAAKLIRAIITEQKVYSNPYIF